MPASFPTGFRGGPSASRTFADGGQFDNEDGCHVLLATMTVVPHVVSKCLQLSGTKLTDSVLFEITAASQG